MTDPTALSRADAARLWMSSRENPMVVTAVLPLDGALDLAELRRLLRERLLGHARFRSRIELSSVPWEPPRWREVSEIDLDHHVARLALPRGSTDAAVERAVSGLASTPLSIRRPPWRAWVIDNAGHGSVVVVRVHHAIADGMALLGVLFAVSDEGEGSFPAPEEDAPRPRFSRASLPAPREVVRGAGALGRLVLQRADHGITLDGPLSPHKRVAWSRSIDVEAVRRAAHEHDAHVNDLVLAALSGALRRSLSTPPARPLHALVPVALGPATGELGNRYASVFVDLPVHLDHAGDRLTAVREASRVARGSAGLSLGNALVDVLGTVGGVARRAGVKLLSRRASVVESNVAGPPVPLHVGGRTITALRFAAPSPGAIPMSASVASYAGGLSLTVMADAHLRVAPEEITRRFDDELSSLVTAAPEGGHSVA
ncbi:MAG: wax ester/triacylglycerol synthase family O-acyltransferase [Polyangiales bacterium]